MADAPYGEGGFRTLAVEMRIPGERVMAKETFDAFISSVKKSANKFYIDPGEPHWLGRPPNPLRGWAIFCGYDERGYAVVVQKARDDREIMVRVGCRWKSLKKARSHWVASARNYNSEGRRTAKQILMLVSIGLTRARKEGWTKKTFNSTPRKHSSQKGKRP